MCISRTIRLHELLHIPVPFPVSKALSCHYIIYSAPIFCPKPNDHTGILVSHTSFKLLLPLSATSSHRTITISDWVWNIFTSSSTSWDLKSSAPASAGGTDRDLAVPQFTQNCGAYNIIEF